MAAEVPALAQNLIAGLFELVEAIDQRHLRYALIGAIAAGYRGRPRFTEDLDFLLEVPQLVLPSLLDQLSARGFTFDHAKVIQEWTQQHLTVLSYRGVQVDWLKPVLPLYHHVLDGARLEKWRGRAIRIASPEGLILTKLVAFRIQDQADIENLVAANRDQLDLELIRREWQTVSGQNDPRWAWLNEVLRRMSSAHPDQPQNGTFPAG
jgi:Nucleotidyl transferase of unknown function (DUF2204)